MNCGFAARQTPRRHQLYCGLAARKTPRRHHLSCAFAARKTRRCHNLYSGLPAARAAGVIISIAGLQPARPPRHRHLYVFHFARPPGVIVRIASWHPACIAGLQPASPGVIVCISGLRPARRPCEHTIGRWQLLDHFGCLGFWLEQSLPRIVGFVAPLSRPDITAIDIQPRTLAVGLGDVSRVWPWRVFVVV